MTKIPDDIMDAALQCCAGFLTGHREIYVEDVALALLAERTRALSQLEAGKALKRVQHRKRGTEYEIIGVGKMQAETWEDMTYQHQVTSVDMREVTIYRSVDDGALWVRPQEEFEDGRFIALASPSPAPEAEPGFTSDDDALELLKTYGHEEARNGVIRADHRTFDDRCWAAVCYLCDEWDFVFEDTPTPAVDADAVIEAERKFNIGDLVHKPSGSWWEGKVVGFYSTEQTPIGYCVQLHRSNGPVQIYPETALTLSLPPSVDKGE